MIGFAIQPMARIPAARACWHLLNQLERARADDDRPVLSSQLPSPTSAGARQGSE
jgi:hypothetical protein